VGTNICGNCGKAYSRTYSEVCPSCKSPLREVWDGKTGTLIWDPRTGETKPKPKSPRNKTK
jgi:RNA polymerase subunit RPABC4/transcription elongation factor Spt4